MTDLDARIGVVAAPHLEVDGNYLNRELSWLDFNERVLAIAADSHRPLLERVKFLSIFSHNLDEFFQIRVPGLKEQVRAGIGPASPDGMAPAAQLGAIRRRVVELVGRQTEVFSGDVVPALEKEGIRIVAWGDTDADDRAWLVQLFGKRIAPVLTPLAVDPAHPFPFISNLSLNLAVVASDPTTTVPRFARVKVPPSLPRFVAFPDGERFMPLEDLIAAQLSGLFPGMEILAHYAFRVTRNADLELEEDEADDLLAAIELGLRMRRRSRDVVRLEIAADAAPQVHNLLADELDLGPPDIYLSTGLLDLTGLADLYALHRPDLKDEHWAAATDPRLAAIAKHSRSVDRLRSPDHTDTPEESASIFDVLRAGDVLVHHPYDSFQTSVGTFIEEAAHDPKVLAIKWTLYRTSGPESPIIRNLIRAAEAGKQVVALVELKAQFDEEANITWARALEKAGVHVVHGVVGLKTHAKIALVVRREGETLARYTHVGTGNYNPNTATAYEDVGVLSADADVGADLSDLFNFLTGYSRQRAFRKLLVAPLALREQLVDLIRGQAHPDGRILMKMNALVDPQVIDTLYQASAAGAEIDLIVRGICCLRPGVPGLSEHIRVRSILGRFLEHSRIFRFGSGGDVRYYVGSADLMSRNLDGRVEAVLPVTDPELQGRLAEILDVNLSDDTLAWDLAPDGAWHTVAAGGGVNTHEGLRALALQRAHVERDG